MKLYIKNNIKKFANKIVIIKNGFQIINPTEKMILEDGWSEYIQPEMNTTDDEKFNIAKQKLIGKLFEYDKSLEVNICYINYLEQNLYYWADKNERSVLKNVLNDYILNNIEIYRLDLRELNISIEIKCTLLLKLLSKLEIYASQCYNVTTDHLYNINNLTTIEDLDNYDYTLNYPEKLTFEI